MAQGTRMQPAGCEKCELELFFEPLEFLPSPTTGPFFAFALEGVVDHRKEHRTKPLKEHAKRFRQSLLAERTT